MDESWYRIVYIRHIVNCSWSICVSLRRCLHRRTSSTRSSVAAGQSASGGAAGARIRCTQAKKGNSINTGLEGFSRRRYCPRIGSRTVQASIQTDPLSVSACDVVSSTTEPFAVLRLDPYAWTHHQGFAATYGSVFAREERDKSVLLQQR